MSKHVAIMSESGHSVHIEWHELPSENLRVVFLNGVAFVRDERTPDERQAIVKAALIGGE